MCSLSAVYRSVFMPAGFALLLAFPVSSALGEDYSAQDLQQILSVYDYEFLSSFKIKIQASIPRWPLGQGYYAAEVELTGNADEQFLKKTTVEKGNSPREKNRYIALESIRAVVRDDPYDLLPFVNKYPASSGQALAYFFRYVLPLGRGYSQFISHVDSVTPAGPGLITVQAHGFGFSRRPGKWELQVDTAKQYLVTKAAFTRDGASKPTYVSESQGYYDSEVALTERGTFYPAPIYKISVSLVDYARAFDEALKTEVLDKVNAQPPDVLIRDHNIMDSDGTPLVIRQRPGFGKSFLRDFANRTEGELEEPAKTIMEDITRKAPPGKEMVPQLSAEGAQTQSNTRDGHPLFFVGLGAVVLGVLAAAIVLWKRRH